MQSVRSVRTTSSRVVTTASNFTDPLCALIEGPGAVDETPHATSPIRNAIGNISGQNLQNANLGTFEDQWS